MTPTRREFVKSSTIAGAGLALSPGILNFESSTNEQIRVGLIGVGLRGRNHLNLLLRREDVEVKAICDIDSNAIQKSLEMVQSFEKPAPSIYQSNEEDFLNLLKEDLDAVIISTPWRWHKTMAVESMKSGKYVGLEVPAALDIQGCWKLVDTSESTGKPLMMLENVCYRRDVMAVMNMVRKGMFGEMMHMECGYQHDLREVKFNDGKQPYGGGVEFGEKGFSEAKWRTQHSVDRNADLYPTHGIGPVAKMLSIGNGNMIKYLTSTATKSRGLHNYIVENGGEDHPNATINFKLGDIVTTILKTYNGETITLQHDTNLPRPYSLGFRVQGTKGIWMDLNNSLYIEGVSKAKHRWESDESYMKEYDHPLWKKYEENATGAGHGGMDFFVVHAFIESVKAGVQTPLDVYDAAIWSSIVHLSEQSIALESKPIDFPDFTKGKWKQRKEIFAMDDRY